MANTRTIAPIGKPYGRLVVIGEGTQRFNGGYSWRVRCECGVEKDIRPHTLKSGGVESCGCWRKERMAKRATHGMRNSPEYYVWRGVKARCFNSANPGYINYGERGITVCQGLRVAFDGFIAKVGKRPTPQHSIDRKDNSGNYSCGECAECVAKGWALNVRWATGIEQNRNRRNNRLVTIDNVTQPFSAWCEIGGVRWDTASSRIERGWDIKRALGLEDK